MASLRPITALLGLAAFALAPASALAQRQPPTPEQRLDRIEKQINQLQRQVFPKGRPADTAGLSDEPAATQSSVATLDQRLDALERQMADLLRQSEENGHRLQTLESDVAKTRTDQEQRLSTLEQRMSEAAAATTVQPPAPEPAAETPPAAKPRPKSPTIKVSAAKGEGGPELVGSAASVTPVTDPGEEAYSQAFHLWEAGQYDNAIAALKAFVAAYPKHRRVSYANNLIGRSLLSKGDARAAAAAFLANYRGNASGERAPDSLYYLGQAVMQLGQPGQACKAYAEFDAIYGSKARADLKKQVADAKAQAQCG